MDFWGTATLPIPATAIGWPAFSSMTEVCGRGILVAGCVGVFAAFGHALATLYAASPLFQLTPLSAPLIESVAFVDGGVVVDKLFALFRDHLGALWEVQAPPPAAAAAPAETAAGSPSSPGTAAPSAPPSDGLPVAHSQSLSWSGVVSSAGSVLSSASALVTGAASAVATAVVTPSVRTGTMETLTGRQVAPYASEAGGDSSLPPDIAVAERVRPRAERAPAVVARLTPPLPSLLQVVWAVGSILDLSLALQKAVSSQGFGVLVRAKVRVENATGLPMRLQRTVFKLQVGASSHHLTAESCRATDGRAGDYSMASPGDVPTVLTAVVDPVFVPGPGEVRRAAAAAAADRKSATQEPRARPASTGQIPTGSAPSAHAHPLPRSLSAMNPVVAVSAAGHPSLSRLPRSLDSADPVAATPAATSQPLLNPMPSSEYLKRPPAFAPLATSAADVPLHGAVAAAPAALSGAATSSEEDAADPHLPAGGAAESPEMPVPAAGQNASAEVGGGVTGGDANGNADTPGVDASDEDADAVAADALADQIAGADRAPAPASSGDLMAAVSGAAGRLGTALGASWSRLAELLGGGHELSRETAQQDVADLWAAVLYPRASAPVGPKHAPVFVAHDGNTNPVRRQWSQAACDDKGVVRVDVHVTLKLHVYFDSLFALLMRLRNGDSVTSVLSHVYMASHVSPSFVFSLPILTYWNGAWAGVGVLDRVVRGPLGGSSCSVVIAPAPPPPSD